MKHGFHIRSMKRSDIKQLASIYVRAYMDPNVNEDWDVDKAERLILYLFNHQPDLAFVAENEKIIGAFIARVKPWWDGNHMIVEEIFIEPGFQKQGVGTELCKIAYKEALDKYNVVEFEAITFANNEFPMKWYRSQGLKVKDDWAIISGNVKTALKKISSKSR